MPGDGIHDEPDTALEGLHVAGTDDDFSPFVESDWPRCPECQALWADGVDRGLCGPCEEDYERAEEESRRRAEFRGDAS